MNKALALTQGMLNSVEKVKDIIELPAVQDNWIRTYEKTTGRTDGAMRYAAETVLFMQTVGNNDKLNKCNKFTLYAAWTELAISGLSLRDGLTYIIPYKDKASFMVGWKGRLEQINEMTDVVYCHEPQVVYDCDDFELILGESVRIKKHIPEGKSARTKDSKITHVYFVIDFIHGPKVYYMNAMDIENIRDNYSASYKAYVKALSAPENEGKSIGDKLTIKYKKDGQWQSFESDEVPMWISSPEQAYKKTLVKRTYGTLPKLPKQKYLDEQMIIRAKEMNLEPAAIDPDELIKTPETTAAVNEDPNSQEHDFAQFTVVEDEDDTTDQAPGLKEGEQVNTDTGEVTKADKKAAAGKKAGAKAETAKVDSPIEGLTEDDLKGDSF